MLIASSNNDQVQRLSSKNFVKIGGGVCINWHIVSHASKNSFEYLEGNKANESIITIIMFLNGIEYYYPP